MIGAGHPLRPGCRALFAAWPDDLRLLTTQHAVDVVLTNCVINLSPDKPRVFAEMFRALQPGGRVSVSDIVTNGTLPEAVRTSMEAWGACVAGALDVRDYQAGLEAAGFVDVQVSAKGEYDAELTGLPEHMPFSALITARKP